MKEYYTKRIVDYVQFLELCEKKIDLTPNHEIIVLKNLIDEIKSEIIRCSKHFAKIKIDEEKKDE